MAMVEIPHPVNGIRYPGIELRNLSLRRGVRMRSELEIVDELEPRTTPSDAVKEDIMFVALGKDMKESESLLMWALNNSRGMKICVLHVHQPARKIPFSQY